MKNKISRISPERKMEIKELIEQIRQESYDQGYEDGKAFVSVETVEDKTITHEGKLLRMVNREAREGDYIRPSNQKFARLIDGEIYGPVFKSSGQLFVDGYQVYAEGHNRTTSTVEVLEVVEAIPQIEKSPNQQRAELIQNAKEFVRNSLQNHYNFGLTEFEFVVNAEKRTVVALERGKRTKKVYKKGIAKCTPSDVFNEWIGKAISLARAFNIDIPVEFLQAVQPEFAIGQVVKAKCIESNRKPLVETIKGFETVGVLECLKVMECGYFAINSENGEEYNPIIIDDTNAKYEVTS